MESLHKIENHEAPRYRLMITRHTERLPSGQLSPEGLESASRKGKMLQGVEVLKAYASDHKSGRAYDTGALITKESGVVSKATGEPYRTKKVKGIQYDMIPPDLLTKAKDIIEEATLREAGMSIERGPEGKLKINIEKLPIDEQIKIAPLRQKNQKLGLRFILQNGGAVHNMAVGLAHQLARELEILERYKKRRSLHDAPIAKDAVLNTNTHGMFVESLLRETGIYKDAEGNEVAGVKDFEEPSFGGFIEPGESVYLELGGLNGVPDKIPVLFERADRPPSGTVFVDSKKLTELAREYEYLSSKK